MCMFLLVGGRRVELVGDIVRIGRAQENDVVIDDGRVSRRHLELRWRTDIERYVVVDIGSSGGTWLNGYSIRQCSLEYGDVISLGGFDVRVECPPPEGEGRFLSFFPCTQRSVDVIVVEHILRLWKIVKYFNYIL